MAKQLVQSQFEQNQSQYSKIITQIQPKRHLQFLQLDPTNQPPTPPHSSPMQKITRNQLQPYPQYNLSKHLLKHQFQMLQFLSYTAYDIILQSFQLKHASYISSTKRGHPVQQFNKQQQIERHFNMISEKLHIRLMRDDLGLDKLLQRVQLLWYSKNTPLFHRYYFEKYVYSALVKNVQPLLLAQQQAVKRDSHSFLHAFKAINAREACLRQLKRQLTQLTVQDVYQYLHIARGRFFNQKKKNEHFKLLQKGYKLKSLTSQQPGQQQPHLSKCKLEFFSDSFNHLTKLTLYCIDEILKWKQYISGLTHDAKKKRDRLEFYYFQENYFIKILSDTNILKVSSLEQFYKFAPKNDPFLLWPVLNFQKSQHKQLDHQLLKNIFTPLQEQLPQILDKIQLLSEEYKFNIRSRKNYDINVLRKPIEIQGEKKRLDGQEKETIANVVLKKIQSPPKRATSLKNFRVREQTKNKQIVQSGNKDKILIEFKTSPKKRNTFLPGGTLKTLKQTDISPLKNSVILEKNKINPLTQPALTDDLLKSLKQQVIRKIKLDYEVSGVSKSTSKDQALEMYINSKINQAIKDIFPFQPEKQLKPPIQLTFFRVDEGRVSQEVSLMIKHSPELYCEMQHSEAQLLKRIEYAPYVYLIKATVGDQYLATIIITLDSQVQEYKVLKTLFIGFNDVSQLQMLIIQTTRFVQKYENAFQMHFPFFQPTNNQPIRQLLQNLQENLMNTKKQTHLPCIVAQKQIYSNISETRFIFKRQHKNTHFEPNRFPTALHFKLSLLHSEKKLLLERSKIDEQYAKKVAYDFLLSDILRKTSTASTMNLLKQKTLSQNRFKQLLHTMMQLDKGAQNILGERNTIKFTQSQSISLLNKQLSKSKQPSPYLEVSDTVKTGNKIQSVSYSGVFSLKYPMAKSIFGPNGQLYYKITIRQQVPVKTFHSTQFYKFHLNDHISSTPQKHLILFSAQQFITLNYPDLSTYLSQAIVQNLQPTHNVLINQLWFPMLRHPQTYNQRQDLYLTTQRLHDLKQLKQELFAGEFVEWFCDMRLENGIVYKGFEEVEREGVVAFKKPFGMAIVVETEDKPIVIYGRVFAYK